MTVSPATVLLARAMMRHGASMQDSALALGIIPSARLDLALWQHITADDDDLVYLTVPRRQEPDFD